MNTLNKKKIGFLGLGLIGGSVAKAIKENYPDTELIASAHSKETVQKAFSDGLILNSDPLPLEAFRDCGIIFLCAPVDTNIGCLNELSDIVSADTLITDVGSVKGNIDCAAANAGISAQFIGGHPMTGKETGGYDNSDPALLENAYYVLTENNDIPKNVFDDFSDFVKSLGAQTVTMSVEDHDFAVAAVSHVPHVIASSLVRLIKHTDDYDEHMKMIAAGGFRDITRIASSSPELWEKIFLENRIDIMKLLELFSAELSEYRKALSDEDGGKLFTLFSESRDYRDSLPIRKKGALSSDYAFYLDLPDEAGAIASVATLLAANGISIKNIGIIHNREFEEGVLRIETYDNDSMDKSISLLEKHSYVIHR